MDTTLSGILTVNEAGHVIALVSILVSLVSVLVRKATVDFEKVKESKEKMKEHQKMMKDAQKKGDDKAMMRAQEEMTKHMMDQMKQSFKPMIITIIPFLLVFNYMAGTYGDLHPAINVTIVGSLPQAAVLENVHASDNGTIDSQNKTVTWHLEKVAAGSFRTLSIDADVRTGTPEDLKEIKAILTYSETNGTEYTVPADDTQPPQGSVMTLQKSVETPSAGKVAYGITCRNTVSNDVAHLTVINVGMTWFWWYFLVSIIASMIMNKVLKAS
jgi:uncharacterized membrane protein (DUF106 family)